MLRRRRKQGFRTQFDSQGDRGLADFDQRQNFVIFWVQDLPPVLASSAAAPLFRNWKVAGLAAVRSGFPYSVLVQPDPEGVVVDNRANLTGAANVYTSKPVAGGVLLLNSNGVRGACF